MGAGEKELKLKAKLEGGEQTAKGLEKISGAEKKLGEDTGKTAQVAEQATETQEKLNAAESDYVGILSSIHPALGQLADGMLKGSKIAGDLASQQINLKGALGKATAAIKGNAAALKLIGAGGAVVAAIFAISAAIQKMRSEAKSATEAIRDQIAALNELEELRMARMAETEKQAATRAEGPASATESSAVDLIMERLARLVPFTEEQSRREAVLVGGADAGIERLKNLAILLDRFKGKDEIDVDKLKRIPPESREKIVDRLLSRRGDDIARIIQRELEQTRSVIQRALEETRAQGGSTQAIQEFIKSLPGKGFAGVDAEKLAEVVAALKGATARSGSLIDALLLWGDAAGELVLKGQNIEFLQLMKLARKVMGEGVTGADGGPVHPSLVRDAQMVLQLLQRAVERMEQAAGAMEQAAKQRPEVHMQHARIVYPDAAAVKRNTVNGESDRERRRVG